MRPTASASTRWRRGRSTRRCWAADRFSDGGSADALVESWGRAHPLGRVATAAEVAAAIAYLASDDAAFVTGAELRVDGGLLAGAAVKLPE
jgi:NAD(P)-dependent dehydrogenase (short-subunit alcohol dehydrogenase family)